MTKVQAVEEDDDDTAMNTSSRGKRWTNDHLPFPQGPMERPSFMRSWRDTFQPTILKWAGTETDPFDANANVNSIVPSTWSVLYKKLSELKDHEVAAVVGNVSCRCRLHILHPF